MIWNPNTNEQNVICWRLLKFKKTFQPLKLLCLQLHIYTCNWCHISWQTQYDIYLDNTVHVPSVHFVDLFVFFQHLFATVFSCLVGAPQAMCESTTIKVGLSCLVDGKVGVEPRSRGGSDPRKNAGIPYKKNIDESITWWNKKRNKKQRWSGKNRPNLGDFV